MTLTPDPAAATFWVLGFLAFTRTSCLLSFLFLKIILRLRITIFYIYVRDCVRVCMHTRGCTPVWRWENNFWELILFFREVGPRDWTAESPPTEASHQPEDYPFLLDHRSDTLFLSGALWYWCFVLCCPPRHLVKMMPAIFFFFTENYYFSLCSKWAL